MGEVIELSERAWNGALGGAEVHPARALVAFEPIDDGLGFMAAFSNALVLETGEGLVFLDTSSVFHAKPLYDGVRAWSGASAHTGIYTHGHVDHVFGLRHFVDEAREQGRPAPRIVAHEACPARFDRYKLTRGYNGHINMRQFGFPEPVFPGEFTYPDETVGDARTLEIGGERIELHHDRGETDDHLWAWLPERRALYTGDLFIWASPNCGNPQKVQRYPREWAAALRKMAALGAERLFPGHGPPILGAARVERALRESAELLESLCEQTLAMMNDGATLDDVLHGIALPEELLERPYLAGLRPPALRRTQPVAPLRRLVRRQSRASRAAPGGRPRARGVGARRRRLGARRRRGAGGRGRGSRGRLRARRAGLARRPRRPARARRARRAVSGARPGGDEPDGAGDLRGGRAGERRRLTSLQRGCGRPWNRSASRGYARRALRRAREHAQPPPGSARFRRGSRAAAESDCFAAPRRGIQERIPKRRFQLRGFAAVAQVVAEDVGALADRFRFVGLEERECARLGARCARALAAGAKGGSPATRQQRRAAARAFVRRHRRDPAYLRWVLRSVGASTTLAVALLGLDAAPAAAAGPAPFILQPTNLDTQDVGTRSTPALGDLDADGDLDVVSGAAGTGTSLYFANTGGAESPAFALVGILLPGEVAGSMALGDLDADGDLDLVAGLGSGAFAYFENTGSATSHAFAARTGAANPLNGHDIGANSRPALGDLDGDGDLDLVANDEAIAGGFDYFENTGDAATPAFALRTGAANPLNGQGTLGNHPALVDLDGDRDLDLVSGTQTGGFRLFQNTGSALSPAFIELTGAANPVGAQDAGIFSAPAFGDLDGDGDADLVSGNYDGTFQTIRDFAGRSVPRVGPGANPLFGFDVGAIATVALGDLDGDGDLDAVSGSNYGDFQYFENTGSAASFAFVLRVGGANPLSGRDVGIYSSPTLGDLDGDGDLDLVSGSASGPLFFASNTGTALAPAFSGLGTLAVGPHSTGKPSLADLDDDGDLDLVVGDGAGLFSYLERTGTSISTAFVERTGDANPLDGRDVGSVAAPALSDIDGDGDFDLVSGSASPLLFAFENTGSATSPAFLARTGSTNPFGALSPGPLPTPALGDLDADGDPDVLAGLQNGTFGYLESFLARAPQPPTELTGAANPLDAFDVGALSAPAFADLDGDADLDAVSGEDFGAFAYFENTGTMRMPAFVERTGAANPLDGRDVGDAAQPALADLDGDGDVDLLAGRSGGDFDYLANTGNALSPLFAPVVANPFGLAGVGTHSAIVLGDLDRDGDLDLVVGRYYGGLAYFENTGTATMAAFSERTGAASPVSELDVGYYTRPALGDHDRDGDLDLVCGSEGGRFRYFENVGTAARPSFARGFGSGNPLGGEDVGSRAAPAAADLDGDGDTDLVAGTLDGTFRVYYFPEPARALLLSAGGALLALLRRRRR